MIWNLMGIHWMIRGLGSMEEGHPGYRRAVQRTKDREPQSASKCFYVPVKEIIDNNYDLSISKYKK